MADNDSPVYAFLAHLIRNGYFDGLQPQFLKIVRMAYEGKFIAHDERLRLNDMWSERGTKPLQD
jgi:hypothetical protein